MPLRPPPRIELWLRLRPVGVDVLRDLVDSGHLDASVIDAMPTFTLAHKVSTWDPELRLYKIKLVDASGCEMFDAVSKQN